METLSKFAVGRLGLVSLGNTILRLVFLKARINSYLLFLGTMSLKGLSMSVAVDLLVTWYLMSLGMYYECLASSLELIKNSV